MALAAGQLSFSQNSGIKICGRVYTSLAYTVNKMRTEQSIQVNGRHYLSDYKVILVQAAGGDDRQFWDQWKQKICANNVQLPAGVTLQQTYTDKGGAYEFSGLRRNATYVLIFCGKDIQLYSITTGAQDDVSYTVTEKQVAL